MDFKYYIPSKTKVVPSYKVQSVTRPNNGSYVILFEKGKVYDILDLDFDLDEDGFIISFSVMVQSEYFKSCWWEKVDDSEIFTFRELRKLKLKKLGKN